MSRVGNKPIPLPKGVTVTLGQELVVEGPKGRQTVPIPPGISVRQDNGTLHVIRESDERAAAHGLTRALAANAVRGVSSGFTRELAIFGRGYRCEVKGRVAIFTLGYSHPIEFYLPDGIDLKIEGSAADMTQLILSGADRQKLGQVAADIRALRPPDPYKNKGIRYAKEVLRKKVGKTGAAGKGGAK